MREPLLQCSKTNLKNLLSGSDCETQPLPRFPFSFSLSSHLSPWLTVVRQIKVCMHLLYISVCALFPSRFMRYKEPFLSPAHGIAEGLYSPASPVLSNTV